jgi:hypothetical protein
LVILACGALCATALALVVRRPAPAGPETMSWPRWAAVAIASGAVAGVLVGGAGARLAMRMLALTSPESEGQLTEGEAVIGEITVGGTLGVFIFAGLVFGLLSGLVYVVAGPLLPPGRRGGVLLGLLLLVLGGTRAEPLRSDNFDFNLLGPAWLAVGSFVVLALVHGMVVVAVARRLTAAPPPRLPGRALAGGRAAAAVVALVALPGFVGAMADLLKS